MPSLRPWVFGTVNAMCLKGWAALPTDRACPSRAACFASTRVLARNQLEQGKGRPRPGTLPTVLAVVALPGSFVPSIVAVSVVHTERDGHRPSNGLLAVTNRGSGKRAPTSSGAQCSKAF